MLDVMQSPFLKTEKQRRRERIELIITVLVYFTVGMAVLRYWKPQGEDKSPGIQGVLACQQVDSEAMGDIENYLQDVSSILYLLPFTDSPPLLVRSEPSL